jgi:hypothetical protein
VNGLKLLILLGFNGRVVTFVVAKNLELGLED